MDRFYGVGDQGLALSGMDDAGEMSAWYVFNAVGFYSFSPADDDYLVSVPLFESVKLKIGENDFLIDKKGERVKIDHLV